MSVKAQTWVWQHSLAEGNDRLVALAIADRANDDGEDCWPNMETLCRKTRLSRSTVSRCVRSLEDLGELRVDRELGKKNSYVLTMPDYVDEIENRCQSDTGRPSNVARPTSVKLTPVADEPPTGVNLTPVSPVTPPPVSAVTPPPVSLLTHKTSCTSSTSSTHTPRAREESPTVRQQGSLIGRGEALRWGESQDKQHRNCHPEVCKWRGTTRGICLPAALVATFADKLIGVERNAAVADVIEWARNDAPPHGTVAKGDDFKFWRDRWDATRASPSPPPAPTKASRVPGAAETDRMIEEMTRG